MNNYKYNYDFHKTKDSYIRVLKNYRVHDYETVNSYRRIIVGYANKRCEYNEIYYTIKELEKLISVNITSEFYCKVKNEMELLFDSYLPAVPVGEIILEHNSGNDNNDNNDNNNGDGKILIKTRTKVNLP